MEDFITQAYHLHKDGKDHQCILILIEEYDKLYYAERWDVCDNIFAELDVNEYDTSFLIWIRCQTYFVRNKLSKREKFIKDIKKVIKKRGDYSRDLKYLI